VKVPKVIDMLSGRLEDPQAWLTAAGDLGGSLLARDLTSVEQFRVLVARLPVPENLILKGYRLALLDLCAAYEAGRCRAVWRAGVLSPPGKVSIPDGARCRLEPHGPEVEHDFGVPR
jgi:hypothetical protein